MLMPLYCRFVAALNGINPPPLPVFQGFTHEATPASRSLMMDAVTDSYKSAVFIGRLRVSILRLVRRVVTRAARWTIVVTRAVPNVGPLMTVLATVVVFEKSHSLLLSVDTRLRIEVRGRAPLLL